MSKENTKKFFETLKTDKALLEEMQNALKAQKIETQEQALKILVDFAGSKGFAFTMEELVEFKTEARELGDDELEQINAAGGLDTFLKVLTYVCPVGGAIASVIKGAVGK